MRSHDVLVVKLAVSLRQGEHGSFNLNDVITSRFRLEAAHGEKAAPYGAAP